MTTKNRLIIVMYSKLFEGLDYLQKIKLIKKKKISHQKKLNSLHLLMVLIPVSMLLKCLEKCEQVGDLEMRI